MSNNIDKLYSLLTDYNNTLNLYGLKKVNQIFSQLPERMSGHIGKEISLSNFKALLIGEGTSINPKVSSEKDWFVYGFRYPNNDLGKKLNYSFKYSQKLWIAIKSVVICSENPQNSDNKTLSFYSLGNTPIYINPFVKIARKYYKSSYIAILDNLPNNITYLLSPHLNLKHHKLSILKNILSAISDIEDEDFLNNALSKIDFNNMSFENCIDSIVEISGINKEVNYNRCLGCGGEIDIGWVFCDATNTDNKDNRDNCRNKYRYWQRARLGITNLKKQKKMREQHAGELKELVISNPFGAFEKFKKKNPKLYEQHYKQR